MSSFTLKIVAIIAMTLDHFAKIIGQGGLMVIFPNIFLATAYHIVRAMEIIGRIAFPLFAFMITEGFSKTRSVPKYIGRLILFAVISEPVFYFAFSFHAGTFSGFLNQLFRFHLTNVFFTLALGLVAIWIYQKLKKKVKKPLLAYAPILLLLLFVANYIKCDYGAVGVILVFALYLAKEKWQKAAVICVWAVGLYLIGQTFSISSLDWTQMSLPVFNCLFAMLASVLIWFYNGRRGPALKWSFYIYYPAHLAILAGFAAILF